MKVVKATPEMFEDIYSFLKRNNQVLNIKKQNWQNLFTHRWNQESAEHGYVLLREDTIVGYIGAVFSKVTVGSSVEKLCNLTTWVVEPAVRNQSLFLVLPLMQLKDHTITNHSPAQGSAFKIFSKWGFDLLETKTKVMPPSFRTVFHSWALKLYTPDHQEFLPTLGPHEKQIYKDHRDYPGIHLVFQSGEQSCYVVGKMAQRLKQRAFVIHYISQPSLFRSVLPKLQRYLIKSKRCLLIYCENRLLQGANPGFAFTLKSNIQKLYRPAKKSNIKADQIHNLYSEIFLLDL